MWEMSNTPTLVRTAVCSSMIEVYWTGIFHPAKGTRRAPNARWALSSGECLISDIADGLCKPAQALSTRVKCRVIQRVTTTLQVATSAMIAPRISSGWKVSPRMKYPPMPVTTGSSIWIEEPFTTDKF